MRTKMNIIPFERTVKLSNQLWDIFLASVCFALFFLFACIFCVLVSTVNKKIYDVIADVYILEMLVVFNIAQ